MSLIQLVTAVVLARSTRSQVFDTPLLVTRSLHVISASTSVHGGGHCITSCVNLKLLNQLINRSTRKGQNMTMKKTVTVNEIENI